MSTKQDVGHFPPFRGEDQVEILQGVMEQEGAAAVKLLDEELRATGCTAPTSQRGNQLLSVCPAVRRLPPRAA